MAKRMRKLDLILPVQFTHAELDERREQLSAKTLEYNSVEEEKKIITRRFSARLKGIHGEATKLAEEISAKQTMRSIACAEILHDPEQGQKTIVRLDTGEIVRVEPMTDEEKQETLFESLKALEATAPKADTPTDGAEPSEPDAQPEQEILAPAELTFRYFQDVAATIVTLPVDTRNDAVKDMAHKLAARLAAQGKIADRNGTDVLIHSPEVAEAIAEQWLTGCVLLAQEDSAAAAAGEGQQ